MKTLKSIVLPGMIILAFLNMLLIVQGYLWVPVIIAGVLVSGIYWVEHEGDEDFVKESRKLWKKIISIF